MFFHLRSDFCDCTRVFQNCQGMILYRPCAQSGRLQYGINRTENGTAVPAHNTSNHFCVTLVEQWKPFGEKPVEVILAVAGYYDGYTSEMVPEAKGCALPNLPPNLPETLTNSLVTHIDTNGSRIVSMDTV